eukprot:CAMPEP_0185723900 /NCGR_PEP_ID=MMETSP1171-20130828/578_1 /TAXON_ID=374046 /ORGANISM="Helicotheca tamensis, Strain CCMP826" /LENGTH=462 /DNA_ID=CAMNT_0028391669 /DNA_START=35 /DNA_END=1423 /DNA_ORIENTATION=+
MMQPQEQQELIEQPMRSLKHQTHGISSFKGKKTPEDMIDTAISSLKNIISTTTTQCSRSSVKVPSEETAFDACNIGMARNEILPQLKLTGDLFFQEEDYDMALAYYTEQLYLQRCMFPTKLVDYAITMNCIGLTLHRAGIRNKAGEMFQSALQIRHALISQKEEESLQRQAKRRRRNTSTFECNGAEDDSESPCADHPIFPTLLCNMGRLLMEIGRHSEALKSYRLAKFLSDRIIEKDHKEQNSSIATILNDIGAAFHTKFGLLDEALQVLSEAIALLDTESAEEHPFLAKCLTSLGHVFYDDSNYEDAIDCFEESLSIQRKMWGKDSPRTVSTLYNVGCVLDLLGKKEEALKKLHEALQVIRNSLLQSSDETTSSLTQASHHVPMPVVLKAIGTIYHDMGKPAQAMMAFTQAMTAAGVDQEEGLLSLVGDVDQRTALALHETMANVEALWSEASPPAAAAA